MNQNDWWRADRLQIEEKRIRNDYEFDEIDPRTDYGSYRLLLNGACAKASLIASHNDVEPKFKVEAIASLLQVRTPTSILDAGCGAGYTTEALAKHYPGASVLGVDISEDGVAYAKKTHQRCAFKAMPLVAGEEPLGRFDLVFCFEFYPFSRNTDAKLQADYVAWFMEQIDEAGQLIIYQVWKNEISLSTVLAEVAQLQPQFNFALYSIPHPKLLALLPKAMAVVAAKIGEVFSHKELMRKVLVISHKPLPNALQD